MKIITIPLKSDVVNENGTLYPKDVLERAINKYKKQRRTIGQQVHYVIDDFLLTISGSGTPDKDGFVSDFQFSSVSVNSKKG